MFSRLFIMSAWLLLGLNSVSAEAFDCGADEIIAARQNFQKGVASEIKRSFTRAALEKNIRLRSISIQMTAMKKEIGLAGDPGVLVDLFVTAVTSKGTRIVWRDLERFDKISPLTVWLKPSLDFDSDNEGRNPSCWAKFNYNSGMIFNRDTGMIIKSGIPARDVEVSLKTGELRQHHGW